MPIAYTIETSRRLVVSTGVGDLSHKDAKGHMDRLSVDPDFDPSFSQLIDFAGITKVSLSHDEIYDLAARHVFASDARRAFVTATMEQFGLARMFQSYRAARGETGIRVFTSKEEALAWLDPKESGPAARSPTR